MALKPIDRLIRELVVTMMNSTLYESRHPRLQEASARVIDSVGRLFLEHEIVVLGMLHGYLVYDGRPLFDASAIAGRLVRGLAEKKGHGLVISQGVTAEELVSFFKVIMNRKVMPADASDMNSRLRENGISHIRVEEIPLAEKVLTEELSKFTPLEGARAKESFGLPMNIYEESLEVLKEMTEDIKKGKIPEFEAADTVVEEIVEHMFVDREPVLSLAAIKDYDAYTYNHSVNACILLAAVSSEVTSDRTMLLQAGQAALFHDIGKILIPDEILNKPGKLDDREWEIMREHPVVGAKILLESGGLSPLAVNVAFSHHLRFDRKGYPTTKSRIEENYLLDAVNLIDVYEALTADRPYKKRMAPEKAVEILLEGAGSQFSPKALVDFIRVVGIYPVGTTVKLNTGELAVVRRTNARALSRPVVRIVRRADGAEVDPPLVIDLAEAGADGSFERSVASSVDFAERFDL